MVYEELRKLAAAKLAREKPGQTLQATALVHEAYLRLVGADQGGSWDSRSHFFAAAAEAMRRILVENARRKKRSKHGGGRQRIDLDSRISFDPEPDDLVALDGALGRLAIEDAPAADLVKLVSASDPSRISLTKVGRPAILEWSVQLTESAPGE